VSGLLLKERKKISNEIFSDSTYLDVSRNRNFMIRSEDSIIDKLFLEFDTNVSDEQVRAILQHQMKFYLNYVPTNWVSALIWEDSVNTVISLCPVNGAA